MSHIPSAPIAAIQFRPNDVNGARTQKLELIRKAVLHMAQEQEAGEAGASPEQSAGNAALSLGGHRAVFVGDDGLVYYADRTQASCLRTLGITVGAVAMGAPVSVQTTGIVNEPSWAWSGNRPVWLGDSGQLTQEVPTSGYLVQIGIPAGPTRLLIDPEVIAKLS